MTQTMKHTPEGYRTVTPYLVVPGVASLLDFLKKAFAAEERDRAPRQDGSIMHAAVRIGDSIVEMGEATAEWTPLPANLHLYVKNADDAYRIAMEGGGGIKDPSGNHWYIGTHKLRTGFVPAGLGNITVGFSVKGAVEFLAFLRQAFGAEVTHKNEGRDGSIGHAKIGIGDSVVECSEAHGEWGARPMALHLYVPDADAGYHAALSAGAKSLSEPKDQPYGERSGNVIDGWGNHWYIATYTQHITRDELRSASQLKLSR